jgi:hypothetical protein
MAALRAEYDPEVFDEFLSVRTVERLLEGKSVRWGSVIKMGKALGLSRGTMTLVGEGEWAKAAELDNEPHVRAILLTLEEQEAREQDPDTEIA